MKGRDADMLLTKPIKVMIVDDSPTFCQFLTANLPAVDSRIRIVGSYLNPEEALKKVMDLRPDVITLDMEMPRMSGKDFLKRLLPKALIPVILVSSLNMGIFDALSAGAVDFLRKPDMGPGNSRDFFLTNLASKIFIASVAKVKVPPALAKAAPEKARPSGTVPGAASGAVASGLSAAEKPGPRSTPVSPKYSLHDNPRLSSMLIAIGASTGGTEATLQVLRDLPEDTPGIVVTQHMPEGFTQMYAERLNRLCRMEVKEAANGDRVVRGRVLIAPGGNLQMKVVKMGTFYTVSCFPGEKVNGHRPSVDVLFDSVAEAVKEDAVGIILTGMGADGARGLLRMRRAGAYTIGQDKESCVVYGMPMVANNLGAVAIQSSCENISSVLINYLNKLKP